MYLDGSAVTQAVCLSKSRIYELIRAGEFPPGDLLSSQCRRWKSTDIAAWLNEQAAKAAQREDALSKPLKDKAGKAAAASSARRKATGQIGGAS